MREEGKGKKSHRRGGKEKERDRGRAYRWLSKWMTLMGPYSRLMLRSRGSVIVWSPPRVMTRGSVLPFFDGPFSFASVFGARERMLWWPSSICLMA